jgi:hypothetical protein
VQAGLDGRAVADPLAGQHRSALRAVQDAGWLPHRCHSAPRAWDRGPPDHKTRTRVHRKGLQQDARRWPRHGNHPPRAPNPAGLTKRGRAEKARGNQRGDDRQGTSRRGRGDRAVDRGGGQTTAPGRRAPPQPVGQWRSPWVCGKGKRWACNAPESTSPPPPFRSVTPCSAGPGNTAAKTLTSADSATTKGLPARQVVVGISAAVHRRARRTAPIMPAGARSGSRAV